MKTLGLLGGMSWESTIPYYQIVNRKVRETLGGHHSAKILLYSFDFHEIQVLQHEDRWDECGKMLADAARKLKSAGANCLAVCTNTMHVVAEQLEAAVSIPLIHIADATAEAISESGIEHVGLLGTKFTMEQDFYRGRLEKKYGLKVSTPRAEDRRLVHNAIYDELCKGKINPASKNEYLRIVSDLEAQGCKGIILGCTEIGMLIQQSHTSVPLFDTAVLHAEKAAEAILN